MLWLVILIIIIALSFDFLNGANDRANVIATTCATKALSPIKALIIASVFNILGAFASTRIAETVGKGIISPQDITLTILLIGASGAVIWVLICTKVGIPISVSHSLIGGLVGAGLAMGGIKTIGWGIFTNKVLLAVILGPVAGFLAGSLLLTLISWILQGFFKKISTHRTDKFFKIGQLFTTPFMSFTHGMNDAQNAMGVITAALLAGGFLSEFAVPWWVKIACGATMGLGTFLFGWRVTKTLGWKLTRVGPKQGFSSELGAGAVIGLHSLVGMPVSTTHVVSSAVIGGSSLDNPRRIKKNTAWRMILAWIITIPSATAFSAVCYLALSPLL